MLVAKKINGTDAIFYIIAQCIGGIIGAAILWAIASGLPEYSLANNGLGQNGFGVNSPAGYSLVACFIAEVVLTAIFLFVTIRVNPQKCTERIRGDIHRSFFGLDSPGGYPDNGDFGQPGQKSWTGRIRWRRRPLSIMAVYRCAYNRRYNCCFSLEIWFRSEIGRQRKLSVTRSTHPP